MPKWVTPELVFDVVVAIVATVIAHKTRRRRLRG